MIGPVRSPAGHVTGDRSWVLVGLGSWSVAEARSGVEAGLWTLPDWCFEPEKKLSRPTVPRPALSPA